MVKRTRKLVPLEEFGTDKELFEVATAINELVNQDRVRERLVARHLLGVVRRHSGTPTDSLRQLQRARGVSADDQGLRTFVIKDITSGNIQGMASIQDGLPLWRQREDLPAGLTRNPIFGARVDTPSHNVAAWEGFHMPEHLREDYEALRNLEPDSWTLEPRRYTHHSAQSRTAIAMAGYTIPVDGDAYRFDDLEASGRERLPESWLMISRDAQ